MTSPPLPTLDDESSRFRRHLQLTRGMWFGVVLGDAATRAHMRGLAATTTQDIIADICPDTPEALIICLDSVLDQARNGATLVWLAAPVITPASASAATWRWAWTFLAHRLNEHRETLRRLGIGIVLASDPALKPLLREQAPDLWSIRAIVIEVAPDPDHTPLTPAPRLVNNMVYAQTDEVWARRLTAALTQRNCRVLGLPLPLLPPGMLFGASMTLNETQVGTVLCLVSRAALANQWFQFQLLEHQHIVKPIIPIQIDETPRHDWPAPLQDRQSISLVGLDGLAFERQVDRLAAAISNAAIP